MRFAEGFVLAGGSGACVGGATTRAACCVARKERVGSGYPRGTRSARDVIRCSAAAVGGATEASGEVEMAESSSREAQLPWEESIAGKEFELLFMPFITHQNERMRAEFDVSDLPFDKELSFQSSQRKAARIESWCYQTPQFRKIRSTYIDAGIAAQVFNSVWYPDPAYDLPLLGIDFLSFGKKKVLCILDFQPLSQDEKYLEKYIDPLARIKSKYPGLAGQMSARFYDENVFFSKQLAFGRFDNAEPVMTELFPAFKEYLEAYFEQMKRATPSKDADVIAHNLQRQKDYDQYSAERDPAVGLFSTYFGADWAERFTHEFLFEHSVPVPKPEQAKASSK